MFFKLDNKGNLISANRIITPQGEMTADALRDGWIVADTSEEALRILTEPPVTISLAQFHTWLQEDGLFDMVVKYIESLPDGEEKTLLINRFYKASEIRRDNPFFKVFAEKLGVTEEYIDQKFAYWGSK